MKRHLSLFVLSLLIIAALPSVALAAKPSGGGNAPEPVGYDVSWPQCGKKLPTDQAFGIVGVNGGNAANTNSCLATQLAWALKSSGSTKQAKVQLYVNTANPGQVIDQITTWPTSGTDKTGYTPTNPYGTCSGNATNDLACSWQYGWNRAVEDHIDRFAPAARSVGIDPAAPQIWWLDVETMNTWQSGSPEALARNVATLEGMASYFLSKNSTVGLYSTAPQWATITGNQISDTSNLRGLANWRPSGASLNNAIANCSVAPLTSGGFISLTQYVQQSLDKNHSCI